MQGDYDAIIRAHFARSYFAPPDMRFAASDALFLTGDLARAVGIRSTVPPALSSAPIPRWDEVRARFDELKELL